MTRVKIVSAEKAGQLERCSPEFSDFQLGVNIELAAQQFYLDNAFSCGG